MGHLSPGTAGRKREVAHGVSPPRWRNLKEEKGLGLGQGRGQSITAASQQEELGVTRHTLTPAHTWLCHLAARVPEGMPRAGPGEGGRGTGRGLSHTLGTLLGFQRFAWPFCHHSFQKEPSPQVLSVSPSPSLHRVWHLLCHPPHPPAGFTGVTAQPLLELVRAGHALAWKVQRTW